MIGDFYVIFGVFWWHFWWFFGWDWGTPAILRQNPNIYGQFQGKLSFGQFWKKVGIGSDPRPPPWAKFPTLTENLFWKLPSSNASNQGGKDGGEEDSSEGPQVCRCRPGFVKNICQVYVFVFLKAIFEILSQYKRWNDSRIVLQLLLHTYLPSVLIKVRASSMTKMMAMMMTMMMVVMTTMMTTCVPRDSHCHCSRQSCKCKLPPSIWQRWWCLLLVKHRLMIVTNIANHW